MSKGQVGAFVVLGLVLVGALVGYYQYKDSFYNKNEGDSLIFETQNLFRASIKHSVEVSALHALKYFENHGAYDKNVHNYFAVYLNDSVPVWQACDNKYVPKKSSLEEEMEEFIKEELKLRGKSIENNNPKKVEFLREPEVSVKIFGDKIRINVVWPYKYEGKVDSDRFSVEIPTQFGNIVAFYSELVKGLSDYRIFERYTIYTIYHANTEKIPTIVYLTSCGQSLSVSAQELNKNIKNAILYTLTHTVFWNGNAVFMHNKDQAPRYNVPLYIFNGNPDYEPYLVLGDDYNPGYVKSLSFKSVRVAKLIPICMGAYLQSYSFTYPLIFKIRDPYTGYMFKIASVVDVSVDKDNHMVPGDCSSVFNPSSSSSVQQGSGSSSSAHSGRVTGNCRMNILVKDINDNPVEGAEVSLDQGFVGKTDSNGYIRAKVPCGKNNIYVYSSSTGASVFKQDVDINNNGYSGSFVVGQKKKYNVHFYGRDFDCNIDDLPQDYYVSVSCLDKDGNFVSGFDNLDSDQNNEDNYKCYNNCDPEDSDCIMSCIISTNSKNAFKEVEIYDTCSKMKVNVFYKNSAHVSTPFYRFDKKIDMRKYNNEIDIYIPYSTNPGFVVPKCTGGDIKIR